SGYLRGYSKRCEGTDPDRGRAAWVASAVSGTTTRVGFFSTSEFTRDDGFQYSAAESLTESGYLRGFSNRYEGTANDRGRTAWVASAATGTTTWLGLYNPAEFTRDDGYEYSATE